MAWRGLHLTNAARLALADGQIVVAQAAAEVRLPLEDIAWVVIDTPQVSFSMALMSACMEAGIVVIGTDATHTPNGMMLPFHRHHRQAHVAALQVAASQPLKKRLWQRIVQAKIANQADALAACGRAVAPLREIGGRVGSGDPDNVEAWAARLYWQRLFDRFVRDNSEDRRNMLLNYGYAVVRSGVARALVAHGLLPAFGLHHDNAANAFNLADDLVEPFRPFVDRLVFRISDDGRMSEGRPSLQDRQTLAGLLLEDAMMAAERVTLLVAAEQAAASLVRALEGNSPALLVLPGLPPDAA